MSQSMKVISVSDSGSGTRGQRPDKIALSNESILQLVTAGDTSRLKPEEKLQYYLARCEAAGLDPRTHPFAFIRLNGKEVLYALKASTDQLAHQHKIHLEIVDQRTEMELRVATVRARTPDGRQTDEIGAVPIKGKSGDDLANAYMKAITKAKRRAVISITGLGMLDESELETIPTAARSVNSRLDREFPVPVEVESETGDSRSAADALAVPVVVSSPSVEREASKTDSPMQGVSPSPLAKHVAADPITRPQQVMLFAKLREGRTKDQQRAAMDSLRAFCLANYGSESTTSIPTKHFDSVMEAVDRGEIGHGDMLPDDDREPVL